MPTYEYRCHECKALLSIVRKIEEAQPFEKCVCGAMMQRVYTAPSVQFKGSGFYRTDNA